MGNSGLSSTDNHSQPEHRYVIIYPNPSKDEYINILLPDNEKNVTIKVLDMNGRVVYTDYKKNLNNSTFKLPITNLSTGIYILSVNTDNFVEGKQFVVSKYPVRD